jgi:uncharacterized protein (DUF1697 family)
MIAQRNVDRMLVAARMYGKDRVVENPEMLWIPFTGVYSKSWGDMAWRIANAMGRGMKPYMSKHGKKGQDWGVMVYGMPSDLEDVKLLITSLQLQCAVAMGKDVKDDQLWEFKTPSQKYNHKRSFIMGFGTGASRRIREAQRVTEETTFASAPSSDGDGYALAVVEKSTAVEDYVARLHAGVKDSKVRATKLTSSYSDGVRAGRNSNTGDTQIGNQNAING